MTKSNAPTAASDSKKTKSAAAAPDPKASKSSSAASKDAPKETKPKAAKVPKAGKAVDPLASELPGSDELPSREDKIRHAAYLRAQARGFEPGSEVEDWMAAEADVDRR